MAYTYPNLCCGDCSTNPNQCDPPYPGAPEFFPPGTQAIIIPEPTCGVTPTAGTGGSAVATTTPHTPVMGTVSSGFTVPGTAGLQGQFTAYGASQFVVFGGWVYFPAQGYLRVISVSGDIVTYQLPAAPYGMVPGSSTITGARFAVLPPLENFPFDIDITTALSTICTGEACACDPIGAEFLSLFGCEAGDPATFKLLKPPPAVEGETPIIIAVNGRWTVASDLNSLVNFLPAAVDGQAIVYCGGAWTAKSLRKFSKGSYYGAYRTGGAPAIVIGTPVVYAPAPLVVQDAALLVAGETVDPLVFELADSNSVRVKIAGELSINWRIEAWNLGSQGASYGEIHRNGTLLPQTYMATYSGSAESHGLLTWHGVIDVAAGDEISFHVVNAGPGTTPYPNAALELELCYSPCL